jgi:hypothetical protein
MRDPAPPSPNEPLRWHDLVDRLTAIRGRAQATRLRLARVKRLSRAHIASDLAQIEAATDELVAALAAERGERRGQGGEHG